MPTITEKTPIVENISIKLRLNQRPKEIITYPPNKGIEWSYREKMLTIEIPKLKLYTIIDIKIH